jgi:hypothetical protein
MCAEDVLVVAEARGERRAFLVLAVPARVLCNVGTRLDRVTPSSPIGATTRDPSVVVDAMTGPPVLGDASRAALSATQFGSVGWNRLTENRDASSTSPRRMTTVDPFPGRRALQILDDEDAVTPHATHAHTGSGAADNPRRIVGPLPRKAPSSARRVGSVRGPGCKVRMTMVPSAWRICPYCDAPGPALVDDEQWCHRCDARWLADSSPSARRRVLEHAAFLRSLAAATTGVGSA